MSVFEMALLVQRLQHVAKATRAYQKDLGKRERGIGLPDLDAASLAEARADALKQARAAEREAAVASEALAALRYDPRHREMIRDLQRRLDEEHDLRIMLQARLEAAESRVKFLQGVKGVAA